MRKIFIPFMLALVLSACGVDSGEIIDKDFQEAYTSQEQRDVTRYQCDTVYTTVYTNGTPRQQSSQHCYNRVIGTRTVDVRHDAEYTFTLRNEEGDEGTVNVSGRTYDSYDIGDFYSKD